MVCVSVLPEILLKMDGLNFHAYFCSAQRRLPLKLVSEYHHLALLHTHRYNESQYTIFKFSF